MRCEGRATANWGHLVAEPRPCNLQFHFVFLCELGLAVALFNGLIFLSDRWSYTARWLI